jgi:Oxidoreductase family, NAD-binding Rossmann fold
MTMKESIFCLRWSQGFSDLPPGPKEPKSTVLPIEDEAIEDEAIAVAFRFPGRAEQRQIQGRHDCGNVKKVQPAAGQSSIGRKLGVALCGLGNYASDQLGPALKLTQNCELRGVVTGSPEKGGAWAKEYGFPQKNIYHYDTMARLAENLDIDIVYVVTPNALHAQHAICVRARDPRWPASCQPCHVRQSAHIRLAFPVPCRSM